MKLFYPGRSLCIPLAVAFLFLSNLAFSQGTANFSFNAIPYSDPDFIAPGRGAEQWHNGTARINYPTESNNLESPDLYYRFEWARLEGATQGSYNWSYFDNLINSAINKGQKFSFGIMTHYSDGGYVSYDGGTSSYPLYLHNLMQAEATNSRDWLSGNRVWVPNWNSPNYLGRLRALHEALNQHIMTGSYTPSSGPHAGKRVNYRDVIYCIDIRGYGNWGEWHSGEICDFNAYPTGRQPTTQTFKTIIDLHTQVFQNWPLVMMVAGYDGGYTGISLFGVPAEVSYYALTARNKWGAVGYRRDQWGATDTYLDRLMANNNQTYNGSAPFKTYILEKYKYAPVTGEPMPASLDMSDLENQVILYHATSVGNGNWGAQPSSSSVKENIRRGFKRTGYRIELTGGSATATTSNLTVNLNWRNVGVAPTYEDWKVTYELRNGSNVVWSGTSSFKPKLFLPSTTATTATDVFNRSGIPQGTYSLYVIIKDSTGYRQPLPLAIQGRGSDGAYLLTNSLTIPAASGNNQSPVANAGSNQTITLPTSTANLNGSASSDPDGSISSYLWQQVSGPSTSTLSATNTANITVSNLREGVYTYRLTVTDNANATATATVTVTVTAASTPNQAPTADAGPNRTITLPVNSASLNGSGSADPDGTIASYLWEQVGGPSTSTLSSRNTANITVSNLREGVYTYRLTVRDNNDETSSATVTVTVNAAANQAPVANAGSNQTITLPASSVSLSGNASTDADGNIIAYRWQQVNGPANATFSATNTSSITVSDLRAGVYTFRLTVTDNNNATDTHEVTVTVNSAPANQAPVANAGSNRNITLPTNSVNLNGNSSSDPDGNIASYSWQQVNGPSNATFSATNTSTITVSNLGAGVYIFRLTVTDNNNATDTDEVTVTVNNAPANQAPVANAGSNRNITLPTSSVNLNGSSSSDPDGTIAAYNWQQVDGPSNATLSATNTSAITVSNLRAGVYTFRLTVTDDDDATDTDDVTVTVNEAPTNQAPVANAGSSRSVTLPVNSASLNGSGSSDPDGSIASYLWEQISGPSTSTLSATNTANITVSNLQEGVYSYRLTVRDNDNATSTDVVTVTVNAAPNQAPVANAGPNRNITLPTNTATLNGSGSSDPDGAISSYLWQQISGPSTATLSATNTANITVGSLQAGVYTFRLTVTDNDNATDIDNVTVTVSNGAANQAPSANAGPNRTITLPTNSATLNGSGSSDADGNIASYEWVQVNGPSTSTLSANNTANITVSNLQAGVYAYRLTVTDDDGGTDTDLVTVTVNRAPNQAPLANAGPNRTITLPTNSTTLNGSGSSDADGSITRYSWRQISGPAASTLSATNTANITVSNLQAGVYTFRLTVTDNENASGSDEVMVIVNAAPNQAPVANAGANRIITLPANSVTLNGSGSSDPDGTISSYGWRQISGPSTATLSATNTVNVTVGNLQAGVYVFRLTVRDDSNAADTDDVTVTVNPALNQAPIANAGANRTITLPTNSVALNGSGSSDPDGTISSYGWRQISGPSTATLSATNTVNVTVGNLQAGVYVFRLTVRDNDNATDTDDVTVTVNAAPNQGPIANAGANRTITLPTNSASLNGSGSSDPDGTIASYGWRQVSGPSTATLSATNTASVTVSNLQAGEYVFRLTVRDNDNATDTDDVTVTVNAPANQAPVANAGANRTITLPTNSTTLSGAASTDPDGTITRYQWQQLSGPSTSTLSSATGVSITVSNLVVGVYTYRLTVRDNNNAMSSATVTVTVNNVANRRPTANAGADQVVVVTSNSATLDASASSDPDGTIETYTWRQMSGPSASTMSATSGVSITVSNLEIGEYVFRVTVRDNRNGVGTADVKVTVIDNFRSYTTPMALYPNPATDIVNIRLLGDKAERAELSVYDLSGKRVVPPVVVNKPVGAFTTSIDVTRLKPGTYIVQIASFGKKKITAKFLKM